MLSAHEMMFTMLVACNSVGAVAVLLCLQHESQVAVSRDPPTYAKENSGCVAKFEMLSTKLCNSRYCCAQCD